MSRRKKSKYPAMDPNLNLKLRRDYIDNRHYFNNLSEEEKEFINDFNEEYYNASFSSKYGYDNIHKCEIDNDTVMDIKAQIRDIKKLRERIYNKSPNKTTDEDRNLANMYTEKIEAMEKFINIMHPKRSAEKANNDRNNDLLNIGKATNILQSWETLKESELEGNDPEIIVMMKWDLED